MIETPWALASATCAPSCLASFAPMTMTFAPAWIIAVIWACWAGTGEGEPALDVGLVAGLSQVVGEDLTGDGPVLTRLVRESDADDGPRLETDRAVPARRPAA